MMDKKIKPLEMIRMLSGALPNDESTMMIRFLAINLIARAMLGLAEIDFCVDYVKKKTGFDIDFSEQKTEP